MINCIYNYLTRNNILNQCQSGFRSNHSTNTALLDVTDHILKNANDGKVTASIFIDLKKAFDTVSHEMLIKKLNSYGIRDSALHWFKSYLSDRTQTVNIIQLFQASRVLILVSLRGQYCDLYCLLFL